MPASHYGNLPDALAYHAERGNAAWSAVAVVDSMRTAALVRASAAIDGQYGVRFPGTKAGGRAQFLAWPRAGAVDHCSDEEIPEDEVPDEIERATYALALAELASPGISTPTLTMGRVTKSEKADVLGRDFFGPADGVRVSMETLRPTLTVVEDALRCLLVPKSATQCILRV